MSAGARNTSPVDASAGEVTLTHGRGEDDRAVANLFTAYFYELAAWDPGIVMNDVGLPVWAGFGLPGPRTLDECSAHNWWIRDRCIRYAIRLDGAACGFANVCVEPDLIPDDAD